MAETEGREETWRREKKKKKTTDNGGEMLSLLEEG